MINVSRPDITPEELKASLDVLQSGRLSDGPKIREFNLEFAKYITTRYSIACSNGTMALEAVLRALKIEPGSEVIVPTLTFFATIEAVLNCGLIPRFADIDEETWCIDPKSIRNSICETTRAIIPVHIFGNPCDMPMINKIAQNYKLHVIEDAAQAHGSEIMNQKVGSFGIAGCWSFYATKNMTTGGEGGAITTNDDGIFARTSSYINHGMFGRDLHVELGTNGRMSEMEAAIGLVQLKRLDKMNDIRVKNSVKVREALKSVSWLVPQKIHQHNHSCFFWNGFWVDEEKLGMTTAFLVKTLKEKGVEVRYRYSKSLHTQPVLKQWFPQIEQEYDGLLPNSDKIIGRTIGLPNHTLMTEQDINMVIDTIKST